jgi:hypothetical protein
MIPPTGLSKGQEAIAMRRYPHLLDLDALVWTAFLSSDHRPFLRVWYDVHVGAAIAVPEESSGSLKAIAEGVGCLRIDVVADAGAELWIIELKPLGNHAALGQVILYTDLFRSKYGSEIPLRPTIICDEVDPNIVATCKTLNVQIIETKTDLVSPFPEISEEEAQRLIGTQEGG